MTRRIGHWIQNVEVIVDLNKSGDEDCLIHVGARKDGRRGTETTSVENSFEELDAGGSKETG